MQTIAYKTMIENRCCCMFDSRACFMAGYVCMSETVPLDAA